MTETTQQTMRENVGNREVHLRKVGDREIRLNETLKCDFFEDGIGKVIGFFQHDSLAEFAENDGSSYEPTVILRGRSLNIPGAYRIVEVETRTLYFGEDGTLKYDHNNFSLKDATYWKEELVGSVGGSGI